MTPGSPYEFDKAVPGAVYQVVLVQGEEDYKGSNGLRLHKYVVRAMIPVDPGAPKKASFDWPPWSRAQTPT